MTPGARVAAAIAVLDQIKDGMAAEQALTGWARNSRFAGSKDRAAVRDHVFDVLRAKRSLGDGTGRALMQRLALRENWDLDALFSGEGHAPAPLDPAEAATLARPLDLGDAARCDIPDWLWPAWQDSLGEAAETAALTQQNRANVYLRLNQRRGSIEDAVNALAADGIKTAPHPSVSGCLQVLENERRVKLSAAYADGLVELQDAASQWVLPQVPISDGAKVLDYCAGGGGKALGFADQGGKVFAHDIAPQRMRDLPERAARAGVTVTICEPAKLGAHAPFDLVFCDAPCSGTGTWRRTPDAKWRLTPEQLQSYIQSQGEVLDAAARLVKADGLLVYATCSVLSDENMHSIQRFMCKNPDWLLQRSERRLPDKDGDGFFFAVLCRK